MHQSVSRKTGQLFFGGNFLLNYARASCPLDVFFWSPPTTASVNSYAFLSPTCNVTGNNTCSFKKLFFPLHRRSYLVANQSYLHYLVLKQLVTVVFLLLETYMLMRDWGSIHLHFSRPHLLSTLIG